MNESTAYINTKFISLVSKIIGAIIGTVCPLRNRKSQQRLTPISIPQLGCIS